MIKKITILSAFFILFLTFGDLKGQDTNLGAGISSDSAFAIQANICRLNDGITMERYEALNARLEFRACSRPTRVGRII